MNTHDRGFGLTFGGTKASAMGVHYKNAHKNVKSSPKLRFRIVCATEKDELRLRIEEALAIQRLQKAYFQPAW